MPPRRSATRAAESGRAVTASISTSLDAIKRQGVDTIREKYGNLFEIYERITGENAYRGADADLPGRALHDGRPLGRLPLDVEPARVFSSPARPISPTKGPTAWGPARSCRAWPTATSSCRATVPNYLASTPLEKVDTSHAAFAQVEAEVHDRIERALEHARASGRSTASTASWAS